MGDVIPLPPRPSDGGEGDDDARTTTVGFVIDGQHYEMAVTAEETARLLRDLHDR